MCTISKSQADKNLIFFILSKDSYVYISNSNIIDNRHGETLLFFDGEDNQHTVQINNCYFSKNIKCADESESKRNYIDSRISLKIQCDGCFFDHIPDNSKNVLEFIQFSRSEYFTESVDFTESKKLIKEY
ncbi:hypothetical protein M9Y10_015546 [Tritrichomonas musculus]|uniref:Uncharacterized protein n=1 Tax=Tritrichomonas musculus TaxID=1915356 RepID=A0ABR2L4C7_9EUKA